MQYDKFCPKVLNELDARTCPKCSLYFPSAASMKRHKKAVHQTACAVNEDEVIHASGEHLSCSDEEDAEEVDDAGPFMNNDPHTMPVYRNIFEAMQCPWTDE